MTSTETGGRHRLAQEVHRPALLPRSLTVVAATVGAVLVLGISEGPQIPAPRPHPDAPARTTSALEPVIPAPRKAPPARMDAAPASVTGATIAGAHTTGSATLRSLAAASRSAVLVP